MRSAPSVAAVTRERDDSTTWTSAARGPVAGRRRSARETRRDGRRSPSCERARVTRLRGITTHGPRFALPSDALNTRTALTLYLLIVSVIAARTVALTLIKVQLNKTKTENNHFCLTGKMARYVAEAVTTHAPLAKHMFFRPEHCAGLRCTGAVGATPRDNRLKLWTKRRTVNKAEHRC